MYLKEPTHHNVSILSNTHLHEERSNPTIDCNDT